MLQYALGIVLITVVVLVLLFFSRSKNKAQTNTHLRLFQDGTPKLCNGDEYNSLEKSLSISRFLCEPEYVPHRQEVHIVPESLQEVAKKSIDNLPKAVDMFPYSQTSALVAEVMQVLEQNQLLVQGVSGQDAEIRLKERKPSVVFFWYHERLVANRYCANVQSSFQGYSTFEFIARAIDSYGACPELVYSTPSSLDKEEFNCKLTQTPPNWTYQHTNMYPNLCYNCIYREDNTKKINDALEDSKHLLCKSIPVLCIVRCVDPTSLIDKRKLDVPLRSINDEETSFLAIYLYGYDEHERVFYARAPWGSEMLNSGNLVVSFRCWSSRTPMIREAGYLSSDEWSATQDIQHTKPKDSQGTSFAFY